MEYKDYYKTLGVAKDADEKTIKSAYRKLARRHHPDVNPDKGATDAKFKEINEAYEVLSDPEKRKKYDTLGADWERYQQAGSPEGFDPRQYQQYQQYQQRHGGGGTQYSQEDLQDLFNEDSLFSDFFQQFFGGARGPAGRGGARRGNARAARGQDIEHAVRVSLAESVRGTSRRLMREDGPTVDVKIPAGVTSGQRLRLKGQGLPGARGEAGDLWLVIEVDSDPRFAVEGRNLRTKVRAPLLTALLGGEVTVPLVEGTARLKVPAETQNGAALRLKGQGLPLEGGGRGDLHVTVEVDLPQGLSEEERELLRDWASLRKP